MLAVGEKEVPETRRLCQRFEHFDDRTRFPAVVRFALRVVRRFVRIDVLIHEGRKPCPAFAGSGREIE